MTRRRGGFTLIELLVVIAIIAILAAILFPVILRAKAMAVSTRCQAHHRQFIMGLLAYTEDYGKMPHMSFLTWNGSRRLYYKYFKNNSIVVCIKKMQAYGSNEMLLSPLDKSQLYAVPLGPNRIFVHYAIGVRGTGIGIGRTLSDVKYPGRTPAFLCSVSLGPSPDGEGRGYGWGADDAANPRRQLNVHSGGTNYSFLDGHVRWYQPQGEGFYTRIAGLDYDGDGLVGDENVMR